MKRFANLISVWSVQSVCGMIEDIRMPKGADRPHEGCEYKEEIDMAFTLPPLPYDYAALEPHIDTQTMQIHHDKHHAAYVNNLNAALEGHTDLQGMSVEDLLRNINSVPEAI